MQVSIELDEETTYPSTNTTRTLNHILHNQDFDAEPGNPLGYVTNDGMWAAVPCGKKFTIIHNGSVVYQARTYDSALNFYQKRIKNEGSKRNRR